MKLVLERTGQVGKVFKKGTKVAASKGSSSTGKLRAIQSLEDWCVWASKAATQTGLDTAGPEQGHRLMQQAVTPSRDRTGVTLSTKRS